MFESVVDRFFGHDDHKNFKLNDSFKSYYSNKNPQFGYNGLGETTYYRTYSRIKEDGTKERFFDTAVRIIEGTYEIQRRYCKWLHLPYDIGKAQESAQEMFERMWAFKWLPPGRGMWTMGTPFMWRSGGASLNNCFKGDTEFITREGIKKLGDCVNTIQKVLTSNGKWVDAKIKSFGIQPLQKVIIRRGRWRKSIFATADHRWFVHSKSKKFATIGAADNSKNACIRECITSELESGVRLSMNFGSGINNTNLRPSAFGIAHGICFGDGTTGSDNENHGTYLYLCKPKDEQLEKFFSACYKTEAPEKGEHGAIRVADLPRMFRKIPDLNESSTYLYGFLVGYFAADGDVTNNGTVRIASSERSNLELVQSICAILGIGTYEISQGLQTVHHKGKIKKFVGYRLTLMAEHLNSEFFLIDEHKQRFNARIKTSRKKIPTYQSWYVESVEDTPLIEEVFCPQVPETYCFTLAGNILTGNCGFVSTNDEIELDPSTPFAFAMDMLMLGVGIGFDTKGSDRIKIKKPHAKTTKYIIEDSREGWVHALSDLIRSYTIKQELGNLQFDYGLIRPKGSLIKGFGGEASGPEGLKELLESTNEFLATRIKTRLTSVDIADLMNLVGKCVVAGNVRRSAEIAFGFPNDIEYRSMKNPTRDLNAEEIGEFYKITGKLYSENRYKANLDDFEFTNIDRSKLSRAIEVWNAMNDRRWASNNSVFSEVGMDYTEVGHSTALNGEPGYIWLDNMRDFGRMKDGRQPGIDGRVMGSNPCVSGDTRIQTKDGAFKIIDCVDKEVEVWNGQKWSKVTPRKTGTNKFLRRVKLSDGSYLDATPNHRWSIVKESGELAEIETDSLMANDKLETFSLPVIDGVLSIPDLLGKLAAGDNTVFHEVVDVYGEIVANELLDNRQPLPDVIFTMGTNDCSKFLLAWAKTKGVVAIRDSSIILISISNRRLHELQILARRAGQSDTIIHSDSLIIRNISGQLAVLSGCKNDAEPIINEQLVVSVDIIAGTHDTYCFEEPELHKGVFNNVLTHQCVEQTLESYELCNLVETFPVKNDDEVDYMRTIKYAYLYGKTVTLLPTHNDRTNRVMLRNRRIGLSQSGIVQGFEKFGRRRYIDNFCDAAYSEIKRWDRIYSEYLVCRQSIKVTSIKPSGTVSLIAGVTPGIHFPEARSYWRRMRLAANSVLVKVLKDAGYHVEPAMTDPDNTVVVTFGVEDVGVRPIMDVSIWEQMDNVAAIQHYWADNAVSVTIQFKPEEAKDIPKILEHYEDRIKAVSFLPHSTHGYVQAPYEQAKKEDVVAYNSKLKPIDFSLMFEEAVGEKFCSNDTCVIG